MVAAAKVLKRSSWIPALVLVLGLWLSHWPGLRQVERYITDLQTHLAAPEQHFTDAVVVDIDETSLARLQPHFGTWPYDRDAYALVADWLVEQGAKAVVLDILLTDARAGDDALAEVLARHRNIVLVVTTPGTHDRGIASDPARLAMFAWPTPSQLPAKHWPALLLPNETLLKADPPLGVVAAEADADGVLRRLPLAHALAGQVLPALPLAALALDLPKEQRVLVGDGSAWGVGTQRWLVDAQGFLHLHYPANANAVLSMRFYEVAEAALGAVTLKDANTFFRGKTVFIGSTANFADRLQTPRGSMSGTYALAIAHQAMAAGLVWRPATGFWQVLLPLIALFGLAGMILSTGRHTFLQLAWGIGTAIVIYGVNLSLLAFFLQQTSLLFPLLIIFIGGTLHSVVEHIALQRLVRRLELEADLDSLTGLPVRRAFLRAFHRELAVTRRYGTPMAIAILDLDHFKHVNDTYGHPVGDLVLKTFARVLQTSVRTSDVLGRWGGEEFVVVMPNTDANGAVTLLDKVRLAIEQERFLPPAEALIQTMSAGVTIVDVDHPTHGDNAEAIVGQADLALYEAKEGGRNRVCVKRPD